MNAIEPGFRSGLFDLVYCIRNGVSAFHVCRRKLLESAVNITKRGGLILFSSYAEEFWEHRLEWFRIQASNGLIGEIDESSTGNGVIVCRDGFHTITLSMQDLSELSKCLGRKTVIKTVAESRIFCEITV